MTGLGLPRPTRAAASSCVRVPPVSSALPASHCEHAVRRTLSDHNTMHNGTWERAEYCTTLVSPRIITDTQGGTSAAALAA